MEDFGLIVKVLIPLAIGAMIGLERQVDPTKEADERKGHALLDLGLRTFSLTGLIGALAGLSLSSSPLIAAILSSAFLILILINYTAGIIFTRDLGITTEISLFYTYFAGIVVGAGILPIEIILATTVIVTLILSQKQKIHKTIANIEQREINSFISFAILALVVLPFLPNYSFSLAEIPGSANLTAAAAFLNQIKDITLINPYKLWLIVVLMTGIEIAGYILERVFGKGRSLLITSLAGGFISSTATTQSLANQSKNLSRPDMYVGAALLSNMTSFIQISILILAVNSSLFIEGFPVIASLLVSTFAAGIFFLYRGKQDSSTVKVEEKEHEIFNIYPALKFMGLFLAINILSKLSLEFLGDNAFLAASGIGSLAGIDAVVISASELAGGGIDYSLAVLGILIANAVNLTAKTLYAFSAGSRNFAFRFGGSVIFVIALSLIISYF